MRFERKIRNTELQSLYRYWLNARSGPGMPRRVDIDPLEMVRWLPHLYLVDVLPDGGYFYRLAGEEIRHLYGCRVGGRRLEEVFDGTIRELKVNLLNRVRLDRRVVYCQNSFLNHSNAYATVDRLLLPLVDESDRVSQILGCVYPAIQGVSYIKSINLSVEDLHIEDHLGDALS